MGICMKNVTLDKIGDRIYDLRRQENLSQDDLAEKIGVSRQTVSKWEADLIQPKADKLKRICEVFNVDFDYFGFKGVPPIKESQDAVVEEKEVVCDLVLQNEILERLERIESREKEKTIKKSKRRIIVATVVLSSIFLFGIILLIFSEATKPPRLEGSFDEGHTSVYWNFSAENIGWIFFSVALIGFGIFGIIALCRKLKSRKKTKGDIYGEEN
jgi:transcriptional regulator with XRE-family HTH domain